MLSFEEWLKSVGGNMNMPELALKAYKRAYSDQYLPQAKMQGVENKIDQRYSDLTNFDSPMYQKYRQYLQTMLPQVTPDSLLAPLAADGFSYNSSQNIASQRAKQLNTQRSEAVNRGTMEFALGNQGQAGSLLGMQLQNSQFMQQMMEQRRQFDASQPSFWDSLLNIAGGVGGTLTGNWFSPKPDNRDTFGFGSSRGT